MSALSEAEMCALALHVVRGEMPAEDYFALVDQRAAAWVERATHPARLRAAEAVVPAPRDPVPPEPPDDDYDDECPF